MVPRRRALHGRRGRVRLDPPDPTAARIDGAADVAHGGRCGPGTRLRRDPAAPTTRELAGGPCSGAGAAGPFGASGRRARWRPSRGLPMRAREPDREGEIERDGVRIGYDVYGEDGDDRTCIVLFTSWAIVHMRQWKLQIPFLARHFRVLTVEGRGNGRADRPGAEEAYGDVEYVDDALAVMDATGIDRAVLVGLSVGARGGRTGPRPGRRGGVGGGPRARPAVPRPPPRRVAGRRRERPLVPGGAGGGLPPPGGGRGGWEKKNPPLLAGRLPRLGPVL